MEILRKEIKNISHKLLLREIVVKLLITILFNSKQKFNFNNDIFKNIFMIFLYKYKSLYINKNQKKIQKKIMKKII